MSLLTPFASPVIHYVPALPLRSRSSPVPSVPGSHLLGHVLHNLSGYAYPLRCFTPWVIRYMLRISLTITLIAIATGNSKILGTKEGLTSQVINFNSAYDFTEIGIKPPVPGPLVIDPRSYVAD